LQDHGERYPKEKFIKTTPMKKIMDPLLKRLGYPKNVGRIHGAMYLHIMSNYFEVLHCGII